MLWVGNLSNLKEAAALVPNTPKPPNIGTPAQDETKGAGAAASVTVQPEVVNLAGSVSVRPEATNDHF